MSKPNLSRKALGAYGELLAAEHLTDAGMTVLDRNWRCEYGEIDLVLRDGNTLVICEVKTRTTEEFGHPLEAVTAQKLQRLRWLAATWLRHHEVSTRDLRIDLVAVLRPRRGRSTVDHVKGVG